VGVSEYMDVTDSFTAMYGQMKQSNGTAFPASASACVFSCCLPAVLQPVDASALNSPSKGGVGAVAGVAVAAAVLCCCCFWHFVLRHRPPAVQGGEPIQAGALDRALAGFSFGRSAREAKAQALDDIDILLMLCRSITGLARLSGWADLAAHRDPSKCQGIQVSGGRVTRLDINSSSLSGSLPREVGQLTALKYFSVYGNQLSGMSVMSMQLLCPRGASSVCPVLQTAVFCFLKTDLIRAFYAGALPSFAGCKQLAVFFCRDNQFTGVYSRVSTDRHVDVCVPYYKLLCSVFSKLT
jgi:hypothetical protein